MEVNPVLPFGYCLDEDGLHAPDDESEDVLTNYILVPEIAYCHSGSQVPFACRLAYRTPDGHSTLLYDRKRLSELSARFWKTPPPGCWFSPHKSSPERHLQVLFNELLRQAPRREITEALQLGWTQLPDQRHIYITGTEAIGAAAEEQPSIWISSELADFQIRQVPGCSAGDALDYFMRLFTLIPGITDVLLANTLAALLFPLYQHAGIHTWFSVMLQGPSGSKKTTLAAMTSSLYGRSCLFSLSSSSAALRRHAEQVRHSTVIYDDLFPDNGPALRKKSMDLLREQANQTPREVMLGKQTISCRRESGLVFTVEEFPSCQCSTRTRCLRLILEDAIPNSLLIPFQRGPDLLGSFFHEFLLRTAEHYPQLEDYVSSRFSFYRSSRAEQDAVAVDSERMQEIGFILYTAVDVLMQLFETLDPGDLCSFRRGLSHWLAISSQRTERNYPEAILLLHRQYPNQFFDWRGCWCILPEALCQLLRYHYQDNSIQLSDVLEPLKRRSALAQDKSGAATKKISGRRYLFLIPQQLACC